MNEHNYESSLQIEIVKYMRNELRVTYGTFFSIPNEGKRSLRFSSRLLAQGLVGGMPDLCLLHDKTITFFEIKQGKGQTSAKQKVVHKNLREQGYTVHEIRDVDEFKKIISLILK